LLKLGFEELKSHRIIAICDPENVGSERVLQKSGLRKDAFVKQAVWRKDRWRDSLLYAILDSKLIIAKISQ
jgi:RimJ/RimL family protein N-acetyltransferase